MSRGAFPGPEARLPNALPAPPLPRNRQL